MNVRELLSRWGYCEPQGLDEYTGEVPLPEEVAAFYRDVGPRGESIDQGYSGVSVMSIGSDFWFPPLSGLWKAQSGYRWDGRTSERISNWPDSWLVLGDQGANPLVYDSETGEISLLQHGAGSWDYGHGLRGTLEQIVGAISLLGYFVEEAGDDRFTEDFDIDPAWRERTLAQLKADFGQTAEDVMDALWG